MEKDSDLELFESIANGNQLAYTTIYRKYTGVLYSYVLKLLKSDYWAEEIVQDIFTSLWINRQDLKTVTNPSAFLYRMTANRTVDWIRKHHLDLKAHYYLRRQAAGSADVTTELVDFRASELLVNEAINSLAPQRKLIYKLKNNDRLSYDEIADQLNISKHTVRNQLAKAIEAIRHYLEEQGGFSLLLISLVNYFFLRNSSF